MFNHQGLGLHGGDRTPFGRWTVDSVSPGPRSPVGGPGVTSPKFGIVVLNVSGNRGSNLQLRAPDANEYYRVRFILDVKKTRQCGQRAIISQGA